MKDPETRAPTLRHAYQPPAWQVERVTLTFELDPHATRVSSKLELRRETPAPTAIRLDGEDLVLEHIALDGRALAPAEYGVEGGVLTVPTEAAACTVETVVVIDPAANTALEGLYRSSGTYCTQCEAEGFRKITWYPDRPDVMALFDVTVIADRASAPVLLVNGNPVEHGSLDGGRHFVRWEDPYPKPSYLFALVAGDLACVSRPYRTAGGRDVDLRIYVEHHNADRCEHALDSLAKSMRWDETSFGLEYDLDIYMIVAVDDFNMGAMENKGLNIFNSKYVLARPDTATDADYAAIEGVIAHEYFHNWTGNRVTCRDWFQLSLKEGLTVYRDQEFSADAQSRPVKRIQDVRVLRTAQFAEDAGPMAHPVRPDSYLEISNFYTVTIYNKGAEVVRMQAALLGRDGFRRGMDLYFQRHDGEAVTIDDFVAAMADANPAADFDVDAFGRWYSQAGTPEVAVTNAYDADRRTFDVELSQSCPPTPGQSTKAPFVIPLRFALVGDDGEHLGICTRDANVTVGDDGEGLLCLDQRSAKVRFEALDSEPMLSLNRGFSAPVRIRLDEDEATRVARLARETDPFSRWDAAQSCCMETLLAKVRGDLDALPAAFVEGMRATLRSRTLDPALIAEALTLPTQSFVAEQLAEFDPDAVGRASDWLRAGLAHALRDDFAHRLAECDTTDAYVFEVGAVARRALGGKCLGYLADSGDPAVLDDCLHRLGAADNMTQTLGALGCLAHHETPQRSQGFELFEARFRDDPLVMDKWFAMQAMSRVPNALARVSELLSHPRYDANNPNRVRALVGSFAFGNFSQFHAADGSGYDFLVERVLELDARNPQTAARLLSALSRWRRLEPKRRALMREALATVAAHDGLSKDCREIASKSLAG